MEKVKKIVSVYINKDLYSRFKSICALEVTTISAAVEKLIRERVEKKNNKEEVQ